jgi:hypothetical protein
MPKTLTGSLQHQKEGQSLFTSGFINEKFIGVMHYKNL